MTKASAAQNEAQGVKTVEVEWDGHKYTVPASLDLIDLDVLEQFIDGNVLTFVREMLGPEQWAALKGRQAGKPHRFAELREAISEAMGESEPGESSASSD